MSVTRRGILATAAVLVASGRPANAFRLFGSEDPDQDPQHYNLSEKLKNQPDGSNASEIKNFLTSLINEGYDRRDWIKDLKTVLRNYDADGIGDAISMSSEALFGLLARTYNQTLPGTTESAAQRLNRAFEFFSHDDQALPAVVESFALALRVRPNGSRALASGIDKVLDNWATNKNGRLASHTAWRMPAANRFDIP